MRLPTDETVAFQVDAEHLGTPESLWRRSPRWAGVDPLGAVDAPRIVVVAPHPDDEVFGAGGLIIRALAADVEVVVVAVTDGEASHPFVDAARTCDLAQRRVHETKEALDRLGVVRPRVRRLQMPDGKVSSHRAELHGALSALLRPTDWCVAPWRRDGHPDHNVCGDVALAVGRAKGARVLSYLVWAWHWATPDDGRIPWDACRTLELSRRERARKRLAVWSFRSQIGVESADPRVGPVLPSPILPRFWRSVEVFIEEAEWGYDVD